MRGNSAEMTAEENSVVFWLVGLRNYPFELLTAESARSGPDKIDPNPPKVVPTKNGGFWTFGTFGTWPTRVFSGVLLLLRSRRSPRTDGTPGVIIVRVVTYGNTVTFKNCCVPPVPRLRHYRWSARGQVAVGFSRQPSVKWREDDREAEARRNEIGGVEWYLRIQEGLREIGRTRERERCRRITLKDNRGRRHEERSRRRRGGGKRTGANDNHSAGGTSEQGPGKSLFSTVQRRTEIRDKERRGNMKMSDWRCGETARVGEAEKGRVYSNIGEAGSAEGRHLDVVRVLGRVLNIEVADPVTSNLASRANRGRGGRCKERETRRILRPECATAKRSLLALTGSPSSHLESQHKRIKP
ncbi:hypothetical protein C8F04DRAFT_1238260 [Mycena alexandri]|uniref:Uncharacterized protein n=1 Tax=Mycena alexandri TaxID=1745969 RepID=A0AAD6SG81_9AGAR|nr:hypothetical protein C8F04DRAFT_1238260 [Mycena alexandri]